MEKLLGELEAEKRDRDSDGSTGVTTSLQRTVSTLTAQINIVRQLLFLSIISQLTFAVTWGKCRPREETFGIVIRPSGSDTGIGNK